MQLFFGFAFVGVIFYSIGRLVYRGEDDLNQWSFLKVLLNFALMLVVSAVLLILVAVILGIGVALVALYFDDLTEVDVLHKLNSGGMLMLIFGVISVAAIAHFWLRETLLRRRWLFRLSDHDYVINEYLIQWSTIYLAVYQFMFQGLNDAAKVLLNPDSTRQVVNAVLSPENMNLAIQPLLICAWITLVMEKLRFRSHLGVHEGAPDVIHDGATSALPDGASGVGHEGVPADEHSQNLTAGTGSQASTTGADEA